MRLAVSFEPPKARFDVFPFVVCKCVCECLNVAPEPFGTWGTGMGLSRPKPPQAADRASVDLALMALRMWPVGPARRP
jgi:hypothetical protein